MNLIIKKDNFEIDRISFRKSKESMKITYNINDLFMIGITLRIQYSTIQIKNSLIYIKVCDDDLELLNKIDAYFDTIFDNYESFIFNKKIRIKRNNQVKINLNSNTIVIVISSIKTINYINRVQIFSI